MSKKIGYYVWRIFTLVFFLMVAGMTLFFAYGYRYDLEKSNVEKTSIIHVTGDPRVAEISLDGSLKGRTIPFQIKGVLPGIHDLEVSANGFRPWGRTIEVENDIVTIVDDVYLVPEDTEKKAIDVHQFESSQILYFGNKFIISMVAGEPKLSVLTMFEKGPVKQDEVELALSGLKDMQMFGKDDFLLYFTDRDAMIADFNGMRFVQFKVPVGAVNLKVNHSRQILYFMVNGDLFGVPYGRVGEIDENADQFIIHKKLGAFDVGTNGDIYYLIQGTLHRSNYLGLEAKLLDAALGRYKNLSVIQGGNYSVLILRDTMDKRLFCVLNKSGSIRKCISRQLKGAPIMNNYDQALYLEDSGDLKFYDPGLDVTKIVMLLVPSDTELLGWIGDNGHYISRQNSTLVFSDIYGANSYILMQDIKEVDKFFVMQKSLYYLKDKVLRRLL